jgi:E3 ubiquitin-protein ligase HECTD4
VEKLPAADILFALQEIRGSQGQPTSLLGSKHVVCWGYEEELVNVGVTNSTDREKTANANSNGVPAFYVL